MTDNCCPSPVYLLVVCYAGTADLAKTYVHLKTSRNNGFYYKLKIAGIFTDFVIYGLDD